MRIFIGVWLFVVAVILMVTAVAGVRYDKQRDGEIQKLKETQAPEYSVADEEVILQGRYSLRFPTDTPISIVSVTNRNSTHYTYEIRGSDGKTLAIIHLLSVGDKEDSVWSR